MTDDQLNNLANRLTNITGKTYTIDFANGKLLDAENQVVDIQGLLDKLGSEPTVLELQLAYKQISSELDSLYEKKKLLETNDGYAKSIGLYNSDQVQSELKKIDSDIKAYESQMGILEVTYGIKPTAETEESIKTYEDFM